MRTHRRPPSAREALRHAAVATFGLMLVGCPRLKAREQPAQMDAAVAAPPVSAIAAGTAAAASRAAVNAPVDAGPPPPPIVREIGPYEIPFDTTTKRLWVMKGAGHHYSSDIDAIMAEAIAFVLATPAP